MSRDGLRTNTNRVKACGEGGLSGAPLRIRSNRRYFDPSIERPGKLPIIGVGGVFNADDAWENHFRREFDSTLYWIHL